MLKQPCRAVGTFVVLDLTMASPAAFMQALLSMWKIITNICGSVGHLYPMGLHCQNPFVHQGKSHQKGHRSPLQWQTLVCCLMALFKQQGPLPQPFHEEGGANINVALSNELLLRDSCLEMHASRLVPWDSCLKTHASRLVTRILMPQGPVRHNIVLCCFIPFAAFVTS